MKLSKSYFQLSIIAITYFSILIFLQLTIGWYQNFSDAVHYLWIADKYIEGDFSNAINTYWGPMTSWLLVLLNPLINEPFTRFRILQILVGLVSMLLIHSILKREIKSKYALLFTITVAPLIASFVWFYLTPDLLLLCSTLALIIYRKTFRDLNFKSLIILSAIGAIMFFIKSIGLYIFIIVIIGSYFSEKEYRSGNNFIKHILLGIILLLFCSPWIYFISLKNGSFTLGTSGGHNYKMNSPQITPDIYGEVGNPYHLGTLTEPNPKNALDACVEHAHQSYKSWEGMSRSEIFSYYLKIIYKNLKSARSMFFGLDIGSIFLILFVATTFIYKKRIFGFLRKENIFIWIIFANIILYLPFFYMDRYTWPGLISFFFLTVLLTFFSSSVSNKLIIYSVFTFIIGLNFYTIYKEIKYILPEKPITEAIWASERNIPIKRSVWLCSKNDKRLGLVKGFIYYNSNGQYLGALFIEENSAKKIASELKKFNINSIITLDAIPDSLLNNKFYTALPTFRSENLNSFQIQMKNNN